MPDDLHPDPRYAGLTRRLVESLEADRRVRCVVLTGSLGSGEADPYSDLDLTVVVDSADEAADVAAGFVDLLGDTVHRAELPTDGDVHVVTAITADWLRVDVLVTPAVVIMSGSVGPHRVVFDRDAIAARLVTGVSARPDETGLTGLTVDFIRRLGLLDVVAGRGEFVVAAHGALAMREALVALLRAEQGLPVAGVKHLSRDLAADRYAVLTALPPVAYDATAIEAQLATARAFLPRARQFLGDSWPFRFAAATRDHLRRRMDVDVRELTE